MSNSRANRNLTHQQQRATKRARGITRRLKSEGLVDPAVGARRGFAFVFVDVDVEFFAVPLVFPVGDFVAEAIEVGIAA